MDKIPQFTEFRNAGARIGKEYVGITGNGTISLYTGFYSKKNIDSFSKCLMLIDKAQNLIGIHFGGDELGEGAYSLNKSKDHKTAYIIANNFFSINGLNTQEWYGKYMPEKFEDPQRSNVYMIDLDKKIPIVRKSKKKEVIQ